MTGKRISFALAAATLLLVGAGCTADQQLTTDTSSEDSRQAQTEGVETGAVANADATVKVDVPTSVDASLAAVIKDGWTETDAQKDVEQDAADADSDNASAKAFGTASYDSETK